MLRAIRQAFLGGLLVGLVLVELGPLPAAAQADRQAAKPAALASPVASEQQSEVATPGTAAGLTAMPAPASPPASEEVPKPGVAANGAEQPKIASPEADYVARMDAFIAPVRDFVPTAEDSQRIKEAIRLMGARDLSGSQTQRNQIADPAGRRLVEWLTFKAGYGEAPEFQAFLAANPAWPERALLTRRAEEQLFVSGGTALKIKTFFKDNEPTSGAGWAAMASAYLAEKDEAKAREFAAKAWRDFDLPGTLEQGFLDRFGSLLTEADHRWRLDRILVDEVRFSAERNDRAAIARRLLPLLSEPERKKAEVRIAIFLRSKLAGQMLAALPPDAEGQPVDWGLAYQKVQHFRRTGQNEEAWKILKSAPKDPALLVSPDDWWAERRGAAMDGLRAGKVELAYELAREAGPLSVNPLKDQTFLAGWIALRHLSKTDDAIRHFIDSRAAADGPLAQSRADYWAGRAYEAAGRSKEAQARYAAAAQQIDTFHGQLGRQKLSPGSPVDIRGTLPALPTAEEAQRFNTLDAVRATVIVSKTGLDRNIRQLLFGHLRNMLTTEGEMAMLAHLAAALGDPQASLRVGKAGIARGMNLITYAYPVHAFPVYTPLRDPPEPAILLAIARQESEFNTATVSGAGARGMLQVMPATALHVCRSHNIKCDLTRLQTDSAFNASIAAAYASDQLAAFRGNYVLMLASYNAGPGRALQWIREFGDPRNSAVDPIDWIERIPLEETREYVKKVLANVQVYRARLGEETALHLEQDLVRTTTGSRASAPNEAPAAIVVK